MKKGQIIEGVIEEVKFPNRGILKSEEGKSVEVKNGIEGQKVKVSINKVRKGKAEGRLLEILEPSPLETASPCPHFGTCGGCSYQTLPYEEQLALKCRQIKSLMEGLPVDPVWEGILASPNQYGYRNKMEFSFGDLYKDGPLSLGMHKRGSFYDIVPVEHCQIICEDFRKILTTTLFFFQEKKIPYFHKMNHVGYLRHLLVRRGEKTGQLLVDLVTTGQMDQAEEQLLLDQYRDCLCSLQYDGTLTGLLHTRNDSVADTVTDQGTFILYGQDYFYEELLGLKFRISPFSFFQTNSLGAEVLYSVVQDFVGNLADTSGQPDKTVYDLYSGTGTIAQILAPVASKVIGVEIVPEAVEAARQNAEENGLTNCEFIAGDVLKILDTIEEKPDFIVLDPPRDGIHPKALEKIIQYGVDRLVYVSCKPTSLARDLEVLLARGYQVDRMKAVDMFPGTANVETVCLLSKLH